MRPRSPQLVMSMVGLAVLALVAAGLSMAAVTRDHTATPPSVTTASSTSADTSPNPEPDVSVTQSASPDVNGSTSGDPESTTGDGTVVVIGDRHSNADAPGVWTQDVAAAQGWESVVNICLLYTSDAADELQAV